MYWEQIQTYPTYKGMNNMTFVFTINEFSLLVTIWLNKSYPLMSWSWFKVPCWDFTRLTSSLAKRSLSASFLSNESVTHRETMEGWKLGEFKSLTHKASSFSSLALKIAYISLRWLNDKKTGKQIHQYKFKKRGKNKTHQHTLWI